MRNTFAITPGISCKTSNPQNAGSVAKGHSFFLTLAAIFILIPALLQAQAPTIQWQKALGGSDVDVARSIQQTTDGGFIVAGTSSSNDSDVTGNHGGSDYWIVKSDSAGNISWQKSLGGTSSDFAYSVQQTMDGGYIVAGSSESNDGDVTGNHGDADYWIVKLDPLGIIEWQKSLGGTSFDHAFSIDQTTDGGYIVAGVSASIDGDVTGNHGDTDYWIVKLDLSGNIMWQKSLGGVQEDNASSIQQTIDGGYIVAGYSFSHKGDVTGHHLRNDYWIVKLDALGNIEWQKSLGGDSYDGATSIQQTTDGGFIVAGYSSSIDGDVTGNHGGSDYWIVKLDTSGNITWQKSLGGINDDAANSIEQTTDGGFIVAGFSSSNDGDVSGNHVTLVGTNSYDYWIVKLDSSGTLVWQESLGGSSNDIAYSVQQTTDEGFIVVGSADSNDGDVSGNHGSTDYWVVKVLNETPVCPVPTGLTVLTITSTSVRLMWDAVPGATGYRIHYKVSGTSEWTLTASKGKSKMLENLDSNTSYTWRVQTYCSVNPVFASRWSEKQKFTTGTLRLEASANEVLFDVYPNPFNSSSIITFSLADDSRVQIHLADVTGRKLRTIMDENLAPGNHTLTLNREQLNKGIYFLQVKMNEEVMTKKVIVQ